MYIIDSEIIRLVLSAGIVSKVVLLILFGFSVISWGIILYKVYQLRRVEKTSTEFLTHFAKVDDTYGLKKVLSKSAENPLSTIVREGFERFEELKQRNNHIFTNHEALINAINRRIKGIIEDELTFYESYVSFLATTANVAPFIGLFGTVWGIIHAFHEIGLQGSANIATVAPGIAEALVATGAGLATAIPAVIGYNFILNRLRHLSSRMEVFSSEFLALLESEASVYNPSSDMDSIEGAVHGR